MGPSVTKVKNNWHRNICDSYLPETVIVSYGIMKPSFHGQSFQFSLSLTYSYFSHKACFIFMNKNLPSCSNIDPEVEVVPIMRHRDLCGKCLL